jgi:hypothetical protein
VEGNAVKSIASGFHELYGVYSGVAPVMFITYKVEWKSHLSDSGHSAELNDANLPMSLTLGNPLAFIRDLSTTPSSPSWTAVSVDVENVGFEYCGSF